MIKIAEDTEKAEPKYRSLMSHNPVEGDTFIDKSGRAMVVIVKLGRDLFGVRLDIARPMVCPINEFLNHYKKADFKLSVD